MPQNLIYPDKIADMIVRVKCQNCQHLGEAVEFSRANPNSITCPNCRETKRLTLVLNNQKEIDLGRARRTLAPWQYLLLLATGLILAYLYALVSFQIWQLIAVVLLVIVLSLIRFIKVKPRQ